MSESTNSSSPIIKDEDYSLEGGLMVFSALFHRKRGHCCHSGCRHCPWGNHKKAPCADQQPND